MDKVDYVMHFSLWDLHFLTKLLEHDKTRTGKKLLKRIRKLSKGKKDMFNGKVYEED